MEMNFVFFFFFLAAKTKNDDEEDGEEEEDSKEPPGPGTARHSYTCRRTDARYGIPYRLAPRYYF